MAPALYGQASAIFGHDPRHRLPFRRSAGTLAGARRRDISEKCTVTARSSMSTEAVDAVTRPEAHHFQAEVTELLRLMVHSVYSETDIFLRELISNASDACDRLRYEAIAKPELLGAPGPWTIRIKPDADANTLTIADSGIGMDRQELIDNLGTVARSGTRAFMSKLQESKEGTGLIGAFGGGLYA